MVVLIYGICSNRNKITSDTRIIAAPTTNEEKWTTNNDKEESYLKACCPCTPRLASVPGERQQNAQITKLRRSRNYQPMSNTTEAIISRKNGPACYTTTENEADNMDITYKLGKASTYLEHGYTNDIQPKLLHPANNRDKQATHGKIQPNFRREAYPNPRTCQHALKETQDPPHKYATTKWPKNSIPVA